MITWQECILLAIVITLFLIVGMVFEGFFFIVGYSICKVISEEHIVLG